jgi:uncharacterized protein (DUF1015 family)
MIHLRPFKGYRPPQEIVEQLVTLPFDKYSKEQTLALAKSNPYSFINIIKPELSEGKKTKPYNKEAQHKSRNKFKSFVEKGFLIRDEKPCFYIYKIFKPDFVHKGLIASIAAEDYHNGRIKKHEQTLSKKEEKLKDYLKVVGINAEPVMFTYPHKSEIDEMIDRLSYRVPDIRFQQAEDEHLLWVIQNDEDVNEIKARYEQLDSVYIADGHHRTASSVLLSDELSSGNPGHPASAFMGIFFPDHNLRLFAFNRLLKDLAGKQMDEIIEWLSKRFIITQVKRENIVPDALHEIGIYINGSCFRLKPKENPGLGTLDADYLNEKILSPLFGVHDLRNDERVGFISGVNGSDAVINAVDTGEYAIAFFLFPVSFEQFFSFSDQGKIMPPKTTWFEPKLLNGLVIYDLEVDAK